MGCALGRREQAENLGPRFILHVGVEMDLTALDRRHRHAVAEDDPVARLGGHPWAGSHGACQVEWVARRDTKQLPVRRGLAYRPQSLHRFRQGELLAYEPDDETAAANLAPRLCTPVDTKEVTPARRQGIMGE